MDLVNKDKNSGMAVPPVWAQYQNIIDTAEGRRVEMSVRTPTEEEQISHIIKY